MHTLACGRKESHQIRVKKKKKKSGVEAAKGNSWEWGEKGNRDIAGLAFQVWLSPVASGTCQPLMKIFPH